MFGGRSAEHEISLQSAKNVIAALNKKKYEPVLIGIDKQGHWFLNDSSKFLLNADNPKLIKLNKGGQSVTLVTGRNERGALVSLDRARDTRPVDVVFPVLHGTYGEDGTVQGMLKLMDVPFVGSGVLGSAVGMDKDVMKRLFRDAGLPIAKFITVSRNQARKLSFKRVKNFLGLPFFVKPANLGSSVGIHKVHSKKEFGPAVRDAFLYDSKILFEQYIKGRELECSVLGNEQPRASLPGEVIPRHEFYSYEAKYIDENGADLKIPADLPAPIARRVQELAVAAFKALNLEGMARVDFFLRGKKEVIINEVNTIPGFTKISMYPKLWAASGLSQTELISRLIEQALERHTREKKLKTNFDL